MGGVVIGSTMLEPIKKGDRIIALTVNDYCQLKCPHCYLETRDSGRRVISDDLIKTMWAMEPTSIVVVGKEPLFNRESRQITADIICHGQTCGVSVSIITNGMNLRAFATEEADALRGLNHIDVSLGAVTQEHYVLCRPNGVLDDVMDGIKAAQDCGVDVRLLHVVSRLSLPWIEETAAGSRALTESIIMFSPFAKTERATGPYAVEEVPLYEMMNALKSAPSFMSNPKAVILFDPYHCEFTGVRMDQIKEMGAKLREHLVIIEKTPEELGVIRFTYNGLVLNPRLALDTARYPQTITT